MGCVGWGFSDKTAQVETEKWTSARPCPKDDHCVMQRVRFHGAAENLVGLCASWIRVDCACFRRLIQKYDELLSKNMFNCNLRPCNWEEVKREIDKILKEGFKSELPQQDWNLSEG